MMRFLLSVCTLFFLLGFLNPEQAISQSTVDKLRSETSNKFEQLKTKNPFTSTRIRNLQVSGIRGEQQFLDLSPLVHKELFTSKSENLRLDLPLKQKANIELRLEKIDLLTLDFVLKNSKGKIIAHDDVGLFYWGYVQGYSNSKAVVNIFKGEISGTIDLGEETYTLAKMDKGRNYIIYEEKNIEEPFKVSCQVDQLSKNVKPNKESQPRNNPEPDNCVRMYVEADYDLYVDKGSNLQNTSNYVLGAFSQVAILFDEEEINFKVSELKVWDTSDPYPGLDDDGNKNSGTFLNEFRNELNQTTWNGDLAHLVGRGGGGGVAYLDVLCVPTYAYGYSGVALSYSDVPTYSWTVNVLTHEIGHNLGSPHTHGCNWNGDNSQIDDCGNAYLANDGNPNTNPGDCYDPNDEIIPSKGTIMSYCHLTSGVGIDLNLGFGDQPGDLIRSEVYNATCLGPCEACTTEGQACDDGDPCTTNDAIDAFCNCRGTYVGDNDNDGVCAGEDPDDDDICNPNPCTDCTLTTITINLDMYPDETAWEILDENSTIVASGSGYTAANGSVSVQVCLPDGCYDFTITDTYGDGICCSYGNGSYSVTDPDDNVLASGGEFTLSETTNFCYSNFTGCDDVDEDDICDDVDPCYDPMVMDLQESISSGTYNARQEIIINSGTSIPENATIYFKAPSIKFMDDITIPATSSIEFSELPCEN